MRRAAGLPSEEAILFSNRSRFGGGPPSALAFATPDRVAVACASARRGRAVACELPAGFSAPEDARARLAAAAPFLGPVAARGVLLDVARAAGRPWLSDATAIDPSELDECAERQGVTVESGDAVLVRTGMLSACATLGSWESWRDGPAPGLSPRCARWLYEREIALVATDTPWVETRTPGQSARPLRAVALEHTGVVFGEAFHLDALSEACAADRDHAFLFLCPAPEPGPNGRARPLALR